MRKCSICGKPEILCRRWRLFKMTSKDRTILACEKCIQKNFQIKQANIEIGTGKESSKQMELFVKFNKPEYFGNAKYVKVTFDYENEMTVEEWEKNTRLHLMAQALGITYDEVVATIRNEKSPLNRKLAQINKSISFVPKKEYDAYIKKVM